MCGRPLAPREGELGVLGLTDVTGRGSWEKLRPFEERRDRLEGQNK
jgi:hypothetical protein